MQLIDGFVIYLDSNIPLNEYVDLLYNFKRCRLLRLMRVASARKGSDFNRIKYEHFTFVNQFTHDFCLSPTEYRITAEWRTCSQLENWKWGKWKASLNRSLWGILAFRAEFVSKKIVTELKTQMTNTVTLLWSWTCSIAVLFALRILVFISRRESRFSRNKCCFIITIIREIK